VRSVVLKDSATDLLLKSIRSVMAGEYWVGRGCTPDLVKTPKDLSAEASAKTPKQDYGLRARESQIVEALVAGFANKEIAQKFSISEQTVKHHLSNIFDKLGVSNRLELALFAVHHRLAKE
jgi:two-component system, NarL family, nitrate/nitrite response regulator NarL